jgi:hypothetical protein
MPRTICEKLIGNVHFSFLKSNDGVWSNTEKNIKCYPYIWVDDWNSEAIGGRIIYVGGYAFTVGYLR